MFEVQTWFSYGWDNCWSVDGDPCVYVTEREAEAAIDEFFEDLSRAGMDHLYSREDYRVIPATDAVSHQ